MRSITSIALLYPALCLANLECRPEGPVVPKPTNLLNSTTFTKAADHLTTTLDQALYGDIKAGWAVENASFSLALVSLDQESPGIPIWEYHHLAEANVKGTKHLNRDSQYLVGSVTKAFAGLALIKSGLSLDDPVTDFLPQLKNSSSRVPWNTISLRSLGNHLAGLTTHCKSLIQATLPNTS